MKINSELNSAINRLKLLRAKKDSTQYKQLKTEIEKKFSISDATIWRELQKHYPGEKKSRRYYTNQKREVSNDEVNLTMELLISGMSPTQIRKKLTQTFGKPYCWNFFQRIREEVDKRIDKILFEQGVVTPCNSHTFEQGLVTPCNSLLPETKIFKSFIEEHFGINLLEPCGGIEITINGKKIIIPQQEAKEICLIIANIYERSLHENKYGVPREVLLKIRIWHLLEDRVAKAYSDFPSVRELDSIVKNFKQFCEQKQIIPNLAIATAIMRDAVPGISDDEIYGLIEKYEYLENETED